MKFKIFHFLKNHLHMANHPKLCKTDKKNERINSLRLLRKNRKDLENLEGVNLVLKNCSQGGRMAQDLNVITALAEDWSF